MRTEGNLGAKPTYWTNSKGSWMDRNEALIEPPLEVEGDATWWDHRVDDDHYEQPGNLFRKMSPEQQQALFDNTARALGDAHLGVKQRHIANCVKADPAYGRSEEHTSELQSLMRISYAVFCLKKKKTNIKK